MKTNGKPSGGLDMLKRAQKRIPGVTQLLSKRPDQFSLGVWPTYFQKAKGAKVWDLDGRKYTDMSISGIGANVLGYCDPDVDAAVLHAVKSGSSCSLNCPEEVELAELLCELHPWAESVRYSRTGGEAMTIAVRIARAHTKRDIVAFCGYHGWHDWYLAANLGDGTALDAHLLTGLSPAGVPSQLRGTSLPFAYNDLTRLKEIASQHGSNLAAIVLEPIRGDKPTKEYIDGVRQIADETGAVFVVDEVSAGFRLNTGGSHMILGIKPDIAVFSKSLGNGYPIAAIIGKGKVMRSAEESFISSTYWTERIGPSAALAMIKKFRRKDASRHLVRVGEAVQKGWKEKAVKHGLKLKVGGIAPLSYFVFEDAAAPHVVLKALFVQKMLDRGWLASNLFYSMLAHADADVKGYLKAVDESFKEISAAGDPRALLRGQPANPGFKRLVS